MERSRFSEEQIIGSLLELGAVSAVKFAHDDTEFHVRTMYVVPIPAALPLFLTALAGVGFAAFCGGRWGARHAVPDGHWRGRCSRVGGPQR